MSRLVPLLREGATELETLLLEAAREDAPPDAAARARTLAALGVTTGATAAGVGAGLVGTRVAWLAKLAPALSKCLVVVAVGAAVTYGGRELMSARAPSHDTKAPLPSTPSTPSSARPQATAARSAPVAVPSSAPASAPAPARVPLAVPVPVPVSRDARAGKPSAQTSEAPRSVASSVPQEESAHVDRAPVVPSPNASASPPPRASSLHEESALLESVREALAASQPARASVELDRYDAQFASGILAEEAAVLRIEALLAAGDRAAARRAADAFAQSHPASSYAPHVRALVDRNP